MKKWTVCWDCTLCGEPTASGARVVCAKLPDQGEGRGTQLPWNGRSGVFFAFWVLDERWEGKCWTGEKEWSLRNERSPGLLLRVSIKAAERSEWRMNESREVADCVVNKGCDRENRNECVRNGLRKSYIVGDIGCRRCRICRKLSVKGNEGKRRNYSCGVVHKVAVFVGDCGLGQRLTAQEQNAKNMTDRIARSDLQARTTISGDSYWSDGKCMSGGVARKATGERNRRVGGGNSRKTRATTARRQLVLPLFFLIWRPRERGENAIFPVLGFCVVGLSVHLMTLHSLEKYCASICAKCTLNWKVPLEYLSSFQE